MTGLLATVPVGFSRQPAILAIFAITYLGIAMGHVPGLKLNRVGIALLGAIAMMIFGEIGTPRRGFLHQLAHHIFALRILCALSPTPPVRILRPGGRRHFGTTRTSRAVSAGPDAGHRRAFRVSQS